MCSGSQDKNKAGITIILPCSFWYSSELTLKLAILGRLPDIFIRLANEVPILPYAFYGGREGGYTITKTNGLNDSALMDQYLR